ncbi:MAG: response regulator [Pedosphaera sp.]|nr:response regulator [Pedosphaera sp.]
MKLLYVENHGVFAKQVTAQFLSAHEVEIVPSLALAREAFRAGNYDLLLVDYDLDDGKGDEFVLEVRVVAPGLAVIGVSSHEMGNQALLEAGANAICSKMEFNNIQKVIERIGLTF